MHFLSKKLVFWVQFYHPDVMPLINLITNGTFDSGSANWTGNDVEAGNNENAYLGNGNTTNRVAELDGGGFPNITVMEQTFTVPGPATTSLSLDVALRDNLKPLVGEGFTVEVIDSSGTVIASDSVFPTAYSLQPYSLPLTFPSGGDFTLRFTELGPNDSFGAIIDNVEIFVDDGGGIVCFCDGTLIRTVRGDVPVEDLRAGDMVETQSGPKPLRWVGTRSVSAREQAEEPKLRPVRIQPGALGMDLPTQELRVSRQHRMVASSRIVERMFDAPQALVAANKLVGLPGIAEDAPKDTVYFHLLFDQHEIIFANGAPSESFLATSRSINALAPEAREELHLLFPDMHKAGDMIAESAQPIPPLAKQKKLVERMTKNQRSPLESDAILTQPAVYPN